MKKDYLEKNMDYLDIITATGPDKLRNPVYKNLAKHYQNRSYSFSNVNKK